MADTLDEETKAVSERWILRSISILEDGKGHIGIINHLRSQGVSAETAKKISYEIFDHAKNGLKRKQLPHRIIGWTLIAIGILTPIVMFSLKSPTIILSAAPSILGIFILSKLKNPTKLPPMKAN